MNMSLLGTAFFAVLFAELVGDKLLYGTGALAARFGPTSVLVGAIPALALKSLAAVLLGGLIAQLPPVVVAITTCAAFALTAYTIWRGTDDHREDESVEASRGAPHVAGGFHLRGALAGFTAIFFTEWGDPGQLATAALAASSHAPVTVWLGACAAMATKALLALSLGSVLHRHVPQRIIRLAGVSLGIVLAIAAAAGIR